MPKRRQRRCSKITAFKKNERINSRFFLFIKTGELLGIRMNMNTDIICRLAQYDYDRAKLKDQYKSQS